MRAINRRRSIQTLCALPIASLARAAPTGEIVAGAIRWDAWYSDRDDSIYAQRNLAPAPFLHRAPFHCKGEAPAIMKCEGTQSVIDAEIDAASRAGLKYWAFCWFGEASSFRVAWNLYQSSEKHSKLNWCAIAALGELGAAAFNEHEWKPKVDRFVDLMSEPHYQKVGARRPLIYVYYRREEAQHYLDGSDDNLRRIFRYMAKGTELAGLGEPYFVLFNPALDRSLAASTGASAISNYIAGFSPQRNGTYASLAKQAETYWARMAHTGLEIVPIAQIGWDTRPRAAQPVPWEAKNPPRDASVYYSIATPDEFNEHIARARKFVVSNRTACPHNLLLIYSWNECDEGGCMMPTLGDPSGNYLRALAAALA